MSESKENLLVALVRKAFGLPTSDSNCCGTPTTSASSEQHCSCNAESGGEATAIRGDAVPSVAETPSSDAEPRQDDVGGAKSAAKASDTNACCG